MVKYILLQYLNEKTSLINQIFIRYFNDAQTEYMTYHQKLSGENI